MTEPEAWSAKSVNWAISVLAPTVVMNILLFSLRAANRADFRSHLLYGGETYLSERFAMMIIEEL